MDSDGQQQPPQSAYGRGYSGTSSQQQQQQNYPYQQLPYGQPMFEPFAQQPTASQGMGGPGGPGQVPPSGMRRPQQGLKLEVADLRIIKECNKESFYKRCEFIYCDLLLQMIILYRDSCRSPNDGRIKFGIICIDAKVSSQKSPASSSILYLCILFWMVFWEDILSKDT